MMFKGLRAIIYKEFIHIRRDPTTIFIALAVPVVQMIIFGYAVNMDVRNLPTVMCDLDRSAYSRQIPAYFENTGYFRITHEVLNPDEVYDELRSGASKVGMVIPSGFSDDRFAADPAEILVLIDGSDSSVASQALNVANALGLRISLSERAAGVGITDPMGSMPLDIRPRLLFNPNMVSANFMVPGLIGVLLWIVTVFLTAMAIVKERERGTIEQIFVTPLSRSSFIVGKLIPFGILAVIEASVVILCAKLIFNIPINGSVYLLAALIFPYIMTGLMIGLVISSRAQNQAQALQFSALTMLPTVMLSGFVFPRASMPYIIYLLSYCVPLSYFLEIVRGVILRGAVWADLWDETAILIGFFLLTLFIAAKSTKKQLG